VAYGVALAVFGLAMLDELSRRPDESPTLTTPLDEATDDFAEVASARDEDGEGAADTIDASSDVGQDVLDKHRWVNLRALRRTTG
jgi:hypothetical protein